MVTVAKFFFADYEFPIELLILRLSSKSATPLFLKGETETTFSLTYFYLYLVNAWIDLVQILRESSKPNVYFSLYLVYE